MSVTFLVEAPDGTVARKAPEDLTPGDILVFDGPPATSVIDEARGNLEAEIEAAGGLDAWRAASKL